MDKIIDMPLLEQVGFIFDFGQNNPMMLVFAVLLRRLWPGHHQSASESQVVDDRPSSKGILTGEVLRIEASCQLPRVPTAAHPLISQTSTQEPA